MHSACQIVIPARLASTRLPEKLLRKAGGRTILEHTYRAACRSSVTKDVIVAVDDSRLAEEVERFGGRWIMTSMTCASGTDRIAEVAANLPEKEIFINVQGDEPEIDPRVIDQVASSLVENPWADLSTAGVPLRDADQLQDPSNVKIVMGSPVTAADGEPGHGRSENSGEGQDHRQQSRPEQSRPEQSRPEQSRPEQSGSEQSRAEQGRAVYFSRSVVPHIRGGMQPEHLAAEPPLFWHHIGLYAYRREFLQWFSEQPPSLLETTEKLEQLRAVEAGKGVVVTRVESGTPGIDTQEDLDGFVGRLAKG